MSDKVNKRRSNWRGGEAQRFMVRIPATLRAVWQREANAAAGVTRGAPLGPWIRAMVERARGVQS